MNPEILAGTAGSNEIENLAAVERQLLKAAGTFGLTMRSAPAATYAELKNSPPAKVSYVLENARKVLSVFQICSTEQIDPWDDRQFFELSMKGLGLSFPSDLLDYVTPGDIIEGYDFERKQIFRNMAFMQKSGYSLMEMLANEWPELFDRSKMITDKMIAYCDDILWQANKTIPFNVPVHYVRERQSSARLIWEITFRHLSPLFSGPNKPFGILGTFRLKPVNAAGPLEHVTFI